MQNCAKRNFNCWRACLTFGWFAPKRPVWEEFDETSHLLDTNELVETDRLIDTKLPPLLPLQQPTKYVYRILKKECRHVRDTCSLCGQWFSHGFGQQSFPCAFRCGSMYCSMECLQTDSVQHAQSLICIAEQFGSRWLQTNSQEAQDKEEVCDQLVLQAGPDVLAHLSSCTYLRIWNQLLPSSKLQTNLNQQRRMVERLLEAGFPVAQTRVTSSESLLEFSKRHIWNVLIHTTDLQQQDRLQSFYNWLEQALIHHGAEAHPPFEKRETFLVDQFRHAPQVIVELILAYDLMTCMYRCLKLAHSSPTTEYVYQLKNLD